MNNIELLSFVLGALVGTSLGIGGMWIYEAIRDQRRIKKFQRFLADDYREKHPDEL